MTTRTLAEIISKVRSRHAHANPAAALEGWLDIKTGDKQVDQVLKHADAATTKETSLSEVVQSANVEARVMIEENLRNLPQMGSILMALTNIYSAYYLQAISLTATVGNVSVISRLDRLNPNRKVDMQRTIKQIVEDNYIKPATESYMSYGYKLPNFKKLDPLALKQLPPSKVALEAAGDVTNQTNTSGNLDVKGNNNKITVNQGLDNDAKKQPDGVEIKNGLKQIQDVDNLAVGRLLTVDVIIDGNKITAPVSVRMRPMSVPRLIIRELVALGDIRESWKERWHRMRAGELSLVSDWIFQSDVIKKRRQLMKLDKQGLYKEMLKRRRDNRLAAAVSGNVSLGSASSFILITTETAREVEARTGMPIDSEEFRNRVFNENSAFMIIVFDTEWERVKTYTRGVSGVAEYTFKQFENMGKGDGPNIMDIMKAYTQGVSPRF